MSEPCGIFDHNLSFQTIPTRPFHSLPRRREKDSDIPEVGSIDFCVFGAVVGRLTLDDCWRG
jgi:hypothetical protein